jgi:class 3 adenylate cyclase/putative methionine-R-sulfoxide reductase with GAF domain
MAALMFTDIVGYSALASNNEALAFDLLEEHRTLLRRLFPIYGGDENKTIGDAFFVEFGSAMDAVQCAIEIQTSLYERNLFAESGRKLQIRIGIHLGDIIDSEGDSYGDPVNIAARVESLAEPGGICITQQVLDHVERQLELQVRSIKKNKLKNMGTPTKLYQVVMPWRKAKKKVTVGPIDFTGLFSYFRKTDSRSAVLSLWGVALGALFLTSGWQVYRTGLQSREFHGEMNGRSPASETTSTPSRIDLSHRNWDYRLKGQQEWKPFEMDRSWQYSDEIRGDYELKTEFETETTLKDPAMLLGLVSDTYRLFLNGHFIGGSGNYSSIEFFVVDPQFFVKKGSKNKNILLIEAQTTKSLSPGLTIIQNVGSYFGEFDDVYSSILKYRTHFHVLRSIYLAISMIAAILCLAYFTFRREKIQFLYFGLYLVLGSFLLAYYNVYVSASLDYPLHRFLKIIALCLSSFMLCSAWLNVRKDRRLEQINNTLGLVFFVASAITLLLVPASAFQFLVRYNNLLYVALTYTVTWVSLATVLKWKWKDASSSEIAERVAITVFGWSGALLIAQSLKMHVLPSFMYEALGRWTISSPFFFALAITGAGLFDFIAKSKKAVLERQRENLLLSIYEIAEKSPDEETINLSILKKVCAFLNAERATIYMHDDQKNTLTASLVIGTAQSKPMTKQTIQAHEGIVGHVFDHRAPLLISDIANDLRFRHLAHVKEPSTSYKTSSCMVFPLVSGKSFVGVLTVADKADGNAFSKTDFTLMNVVSKIIAFLIHNRELERKSESRAG